MSLCGCPVRHPDFRPNGLCYCILVTTLELLSHQFEDAGHQVSQAIAGLDDPGMDHRPTPGGLTPRETLRHLAEAYVAFAKSCRGEKHEWGTYEVQDTSTEALVAHWRRTREDAVRLALEQSEPANLLNACAYIVAHDYYHVGQLVQTRLAYDPSWNSYAIYRFG